MKKKWVICFLWLLVTAVAAMIFWFSSQNGEDSLNTSGGIVTSLLRLFVPGFEDMTIKEKTAIYKQIHYLVRKGAHFTEFAMLGVSLLLLFRALDLRCPILCAWVVGTLYACTDELHQMLVDSRAAMWQDVCIDSAGVLAGVLLVTLLLFLRRRKRKEI